MKIAGAPISWGVCEVEGWGHQMAPGRVLAEMAQIGLTATEFGPPGWLPADPVRRAEAVGGYGLTPVGAFFLAVLHDPDFDPVPMVNAELDAFEEAGGDCLILAADSGRAGYDERPTLHACAWRTLLTNLSRIREVCEARGVTACLHPHWGTMVQTPAEIDRVMADSPVGLCLDTGHIVAAGGDVETITETYASRVDIVHAKDVHAPLAAELLAGRITWSEGVRAGMFAPIGQGDIDFASLVATLTRAGFDGYYVLEQDIMIDAEPPDGEGPIRNARMSLTALTALAGEFAQPEHGGNTPSDMP